MPLSETPLLSTRIQILSVLPPAAFRHAQGRKQLLEEGKELASPYLAPYISSVKETAAPYVAKLEELRKSEKVEKMLEAFNEAREYPVEKVAALKEKAVDLIKYEKVKAYREQWNVKTAEFQADMARLIKELPVVASAAAQKGADKVKTAATALAEELETHMAQVKALVAQGYGMASAIELEAVKQKVAAMSSSLLKQMETEAKSGVELYKVEGFSLQDFLERLKRVGSAIVAEGKALLPLKEEEPLKPAPSEPSVDAVPSSKVSDYESATEEDAPPHCRPHRLRRSGGPGGVRLGTVPAAWPRDLHEIMRPPSLCVHVSCSNRLAAP